MSRSRAAALVLALTASPFLAAPAAAQSFTLEAAAGNSRYSERDASFDDSATALGITGRYTWPSGWGIEGGVRGHGEWVMSAGGVTARPAATSVLVGASYELPLGPVTLGARLGGHAWRMSGNLIGPGSQWLGRFEDSGSGLYYSLAASYALTERSSIGLAYSDFRLQDGARIKSTDIRFAYRF